MCWEEMDFWKELSKEEWKESALEEKGEWWC